MGKMSVFGLGVLIFIVLAFAIYIFRSFPYLLAAVLIAEWVIGAMTIIGPLLSPAGRSGWFSKAVYTLLALALANVYMLFLAKTWNVQPQGAYRFTLHWQDGVIAFFAKLLKFVVDFVDGLSGALFTGAHPIQSSMDQVTSAARSGFSAAQYGPGGLHAGVLLTVVLGVIGCFMSAGIVKGLLAKPKSSHGGGGGHH